MKLFIFDMNGVMVHNKSSIPSIAKSLDISYDEFCKAIGADIITKDTSAYNLGDIAPLMKGTITPKQFWNNFTNRCGISVPEDLWYTFFNPVKYEQMYSIISDLKKAGYRVVCGTNTSQDHYQYLLKHHYYSCFDTIYASHIINIIKPDEEFWNYILKQENVNACDVFFVDDAVENIEAAQKLGITSHLFTEPEKLGKILKDIYVF